MERPFVELAQARLLAEALAIGLLVGTERYKARDPGEKKTAGVRTFAAFALLGGICGLLDQLAIGLAAFAALAALVAIGYYRESSESLGLTTEVAALLVFWLGYLVHTHEILAIAAAIVLTILLASKETMHAFVKESISERELFDTLKFLAVVLVVYPLLPDRALGPLGFFNPARTWLLVALVSTIAYAGYFLVRLLGPRRGLFASAILGGVVSSTATTMALAGRARENPGSSRSLGIAAVSANAVQFPRLLVLIAVVDAVFAQRVLLAFLAMTSVGALAAVTLWRRSIDGNDRVLLSISNPYSITPALKFGGLFVAILLVVRVAQAWLGEAGIYAAAVLGGPLSTSAVALSLANVSAAGRLDPGDATLALLLGITANAVTKFGICWAQGSSRLAFWLGGGLVVMLAAGYLLFGLDRLGIASLPAAP
jgi:uncharacterized membrane protein (DUF4010 family)